MCCSDSGDCVWSWVFASRTCRTWWLAGGMLFKFHLQSSRILTNIGPKGEYSGGPKPCHTSRRLRFGSFCGFKHSQLGVSRRWFNTLDVSTPSVWWLGAIKFYLWCVCFWMRLCRGENLWTYLSHGWQINQGLFPSATLPQLQRYPNYLTGFASRFQTL